MNFWQRIFGRKQADQSSSRQRSPSSEALGDVEPDDNFSTAESTSIAPEPQSSADVPGTEIGQQLRHLHERASREGWSVSDSVTFACLGCNDISKVVVASSFTDPAKTVHGLELNVTRVEGISYKDPNDPLVCDTCGASRFRVCVKRNAFKDVVEEALAARTPCKEDISRGLRDADTGALFSDHGMQFAADFSSLWAQVLPHIDEESGINENFGVDTVRSTSSDIGMRHVGHIEGVSSFNRKTNCLLVMIRGNSGGYWWAVEYDR